MGIFDRFKSKKETELGVSSKKAAPESEVKSSKATKVEVASEKKTKAKTVEVEAPKAKKAKGQKSEPAKVDLTGTLVAPLITEKSAHGAGAGVYAFVVMKRATKIDIRNAVERTYGVHVTGVRVSVVPGRTVRFGRSLGRRGSWKKAFVTLKSGDRLPIYDSASE